MDQQPNSLACYDHPTFGAAEMGGAAEMDGAAEMECRGLEESAIERDWELALAKLRRPQAPMPLFVPPRAHVRSFVTAFVVLSSFMGAAALFARAALEVTALVP